jgi:hypothetical protein
VTRAQKTRSAARRWHSVNVTHRGTLSSPIAHRAAGDVQKRCDLRLAGGGGAGSSVKPSENFCARPFGVTGSAL